MPACFRLPAIPSLFVCAQINSLLQERIPRDLIFADLVFFLVNFPVFEVLLYPVLLAF